MRLHEITEARRLSSKFRKWFEGSVVTTWDDQPLVVYHGTDAQFTRFSLSKAGSRSGGVAGHAIRGIYFYGDSDIDGSSGAENAKAWGNTVKRCYLHITNPLSVNAMIDGDTEEQAQAAGHDGIMQSGGRVYVVFDPDQVWTIK